MLNRLESCKSIEKWWNLKKRQKLLKQYRNEFGYFNMQKLTNLRNVINEK